MEYDVVIAGGGVAGLVAARDLVDTGLRVRLLEASSRLGGRTLSEPGSVHMEDLGAEFVHPGLHKLVMAELARYGGELLPADPGGAALSRIDGKVGTLRDAKDPELAKLFQKIDRDSASISRDCLVDDSCNSLDKPWASYLQDLPFDPVLLREFEAWSVSLTGAPADQVCALAVLRDLQMFGCARQAYVDKEYRIKGGTQSIANAIAGSLGGVVATGSPVSAITAGSNGVGIRTAGPGAVIQALAVIVTIPFNSLWRVDFSPALPAALRRASRTGHAGAASKFWFDGRADFCSNLAIDMPLALSFAGPDPRRRCIIGDEELQPSDLVDLLGLFDVHCDPGNVTSHDWNNDHCYSGTWIAPRPGQLAVIDELRGQQGRVRFAGGDLSTVWPGWIEGAIHSGKEAAGQVLSLIRP